LRHIILMLLLLVTTSGSKDPRISFEFVVPTIIQYEGFRSKAYHDSNKYVIGYGTAYHSNNRPVRRGDIITKLEAKNNMIHHIRNNIYPYIEDIYPNLTHNQKIAIISFVYNIGGPAFRKTIVYRNIKNGRFYKASVSLLRYSNCKGCRKGLLLNRRKQEKKIFNTKKDIKVINEQD